jgi:hypothetical protein
LELGVKFRSDVAGQVAAIRFYKAAGDDAGHTGSLWSEDGTLLATGTLADEGATGWQQLDLATPVSILANTTYVASYHSGRGLFYYDFFAFEGHGIDAPPLHALASGVGGNGVYVLGAGGQFPTSSYEASNYWVDLVFSPDYAFECDLTVSASTVDVGETLTFVVTSTPAGRLYWTGDGPTGPMEPKFFSDISAGATSIPIVYSARMSPGVYHRDVLVTDAGGAPLCATHKSLEVTVRQPFSCPISVTPNPVHAPGIATYAIGGNATGSVSWFVTKAPSTVEQGPLADSRPAPGSYDVAVGETDVGTYGRRAEITNADQTVICLTPTVPLTVEADSSTFSLFGPSDTPTQTYDAQTGIELGVKFRADVSGQALGVRFYKAAGDTGVHTGSLWSSAGALLATGTFTGESASGWQELVFPGAVPIAANTTYVASYHTSRGLFYYDYFTFLNQGIDRPPLHALRDGADGGNGVFAIAPDGAFPSATYQASNYWVDVSFSPQPGMDPGDKKARFEYPGLEFGWERGGQGFLVRDFALAVANPNASTITVTVTLVADDPEFVYPPDSFCAGAIGVCTWYTYQRTLAPYSHGERWLAGNWNVMGGAFPIYPSETFLRWRGTVVLESQPALPFYSFDPRSFSISGTGPTVADGWFAGWNVWGANVPVSWDRDLQMFVVPYANFWHNWDAWIAGWQTQVTFTNGTASPVTFDVENHLYSGGFGTADQPCPPGGWDGRPFPADMLELPVTLAPGETRTMDLFRAQLPAPDIAAHSLESVLFIRTDHASPDGLSVQVNISPQPSGHYLGCGF